MTGYKTLKTLVMTSYKQLVRNGELRGAWLILQLLRHGNLSLGLGDTAWKVETILDQLKCPVRYSHNFNIATFYIPKDKA